MKQIIANENDDKISNDYVVDGEGESSVQLTNTSVFDEQQAFQETEKTRSELNFDVTKPIMCNKCTKDFKVYRWECCPKCKNWYCAKCKKNLSCCKN